MPSVVREESGNLQATLNVTIRHSDYKRKLSEEIGKLQGKVELKGFRKGKAPSSLVTKMYGRGLLLDIINTIVQDTLFKFIEDENISVLGQPIQSLSQELYAFDPRDARDYLFKFDVGLVPEFELQGLSHDAVFTIPVPEITDEMVDQESEALRNNYREQKDTQPPYEEKDLLTFLATEADEAGERKENGLESKFTVMFGDITEASIEKLRHLELGGTAVLNIFSLEKNRDSAFVLRYFLHTDENADVGPLFILTLEKAIRNFPRTLDQAFYDQVFGEDTVHNEEEYRTALRNHIASSFAGKSNSLLFRDVQKFLLEQNPLELPDEFMRRWILETNKESDTSAIEREYPLFAKNLIWTIIRNRIIKLYHIWVSEQELQAFFEAQVRQYFGNIMPMDSNFIDGMVKRLMGDEKQVEKVVDEIIYGKLVQVFRENVTVQEEKMSLESFEALFEKIEEKEKALSSTEEE